MEKGNNRITIFVIVMSLLLTACGGGSSTPTTPVETQKITGQFIDAAVKNLRYTCADGKTDKTDENGTFSCTTLPVSFSHGGINLGSIAIMTEDNKVYPQDIAGVDRDDFSSEVAIKIAYLLQAFDTDGDISKTIELDENDVVSDAKDLKDLTFAQIDSIITNSGRTPFDIEEVRTHLINNAGTGVDQTVAKDKQAVDIDLKNLNLGDLSAVTADLTFPSAGKNGTSISYVISNGSAISSAGVITRPSFTDKSQSV